MVVSNIAKFFRVGYFFGAPGSIRLGLMPKPKVVRSVVRRPRGVGED